MKPIILFLLSLGISFNAQLSAQKRFEGQLQNPQGKTLPCSVELTGAESGDLGKLSFSENETYGIEGQVTNQTSEGKKYKGMLSFNGAKALSFMLVETPGILFVSVNFNGQSVCTGLIFENKNNTSPLTKPSKPTNGNRDPILIGKWYEVGKYTSGSLNTETYLTFFQDGTISQTSASHGSWSYNDGSSGGYNSGGFQEDPQIANLMRQGFRWTTENGKICWNGTDGSKSCGITYEFEGQYLFITYPGNKKSTGYKRSN